MRICTVGLYTALFLMPGQAELGRPSGTSSSAPRGAVYFISPIGNDLNPGTKDQPWRTIEKAANTLTAGETVYIRAGNYGERLIPLHSGSAGNYIIYAAYPGDTATIDGSGVLVPIDEGLIYISGKSYLHFSGLHISRSQQAGILVDNTSSHITLEQNHTYNTGSSGIGVWNSNNTTIRDNEVDLACSGGMQESLTVAGTDTFEVQGNLVHNESAGYNKEGICIKDGSSNGKVFRNHVHHVRAVGIYLDAWDKHTYNIEVFQNRVHDVAESNGLTVASEMGGLLENIKIYNNISYHNRYCGLSISINGPGGPQGQHPMKDILVVNNTFYNNGWTTWGGGIAIDNPDAQNVITRNNIVSQNLYFQIAVAADVPVGTYSIDHNLVDGYRDTEGEVYGNDHVVGDPRFAAAVTADFHLLGDSPAIDRGSSSGAPANDFDGTLRPQDGNGDGIAICDIGAFEFAGFRTCLPLLLHQ